MGDKYTIENAPAPSKYTVEDAPPTDDAPTQSWWDRVTAPITEIQKPDPNAPALSGKEAIKAVGNIGAGGLGMLLHPINTLAGVGGMVTAPFEMMAGTPFSKTVPGEMIQGFRENPLGTIEAGIGQAGAMPFAEGALRGTGRLAKAPFDKAGSFVRSLTDTTPQTAADLAARTTAENTEAATKAQTANQTAAQKFNTDAFNATREQKQNLEAYEAEKRNKAQEIGTQDVGDQMEVARKHQQDVAEATTHNQKVQAKHTQTVEETTQHNNALNQMLELRRKQEAKLTQDTQAYYDQEDAAKAKAKDEENAAWSPWRQKMQGATIDGGDIAKPLEKISKNSPEVSRLLNQLTPDPAEAAPDSLYAQDRAAIMKSLGYQGDYFQLPAETRVMIDKAAASSGLTPEPIDFEPQAGKPIPVEQVHRANSILQRQIASGRFEGPLLGEMKQLANVFRNAITRATADAGALPELNAAKEATIKYQNAFGRERNLPVTHDEVMEKQANPEAFKERSDEQRLSGAAGYDPSLVESYRNVKAQREGLKNLPSEDALRKQLKQHPEPPTVGDLRPGYALKEVPKAPPARLTSGSPQERAFQETTLPKGVKFPTKTPEVVPETKLISPEDIQKAKAEAAQKKGETIRAKGGYAGLRTTLYSVPAAVGTAALGHPFAALMELGTGPSVYATAQSLANALESPRVVKMLSKVTAADIEKIPPELQTEVLKRMRALAVAAKMKGVPVSPAVMGWAGLTGGLPSSHPVQQSNPMQ
jgi:hypothetical protein